MEDAVSRQREFYKNTAEKYEAELNHGDEHGFAYAFLLGMLDFLDINSVLDVGAGTGRFMRFLKNAKPSLKVVGIEPSDLRHQGYKYGLTSVELIEGDAQELQFRDGEFDMVCESGALHHIPNPHKAVAEMLRVARKAIFVSDSNNFGQGGRVSRLVKQAINSVGLWPMTAYLKTGGKGYHFSPEGDGIFYSYSVFSDYTQIRCACKSVHILNTVDAGINPYRTATHVALLGIK